MAQTCAPIFSFSCHARFKSSQLGCPRPQGAHEFRHNHNASFAILAPGLVPSDLVTMFQGLVAGPDGPPEPALPVAAVAAVGAGRGRGRGRGRRGRHRRGQPHTEITKVRMSLVQTQLSKGRQSRLLAHATAEDAADMVVKVLGRTSTIDSKASASQWREVDFGDGTFQAGFMQDGRKTDKADRSRVLVSHALAQAKGIGEFVAQPCTLLVSTRVFDDASMWIASPPSTSRIAALQAPADAP